MSLLCLNKWKSSSNVLQFRLKCLIFDENFKFPKSYVHKNYCHCKPTKRGSRLSNDVINFAPLWYVNFKLKICILKIKTGGGGCLCPLFILLLQCNTIKYNTIIKHYKIEALIIFYGIFFSV